MKPEHKKAINELADWMDKYGVELLMEVRREDEAYLSAYFNDDEEVFLVKNSCWFECDSSKLRDLTKGK